MTTSSAARTAKWRTKMRPGPPTWQALGWYRSATSDPIRRHSYAHITLMALSVA